MSELSVRQYLHNDGSGLTWGYDKREADKFIADLEESHKMEIGQLLIEIAELKKEKEYAIEHTAEVINVQERELRHNRYKRCLAMSSLWRERAETSTDRDNTLISNRRCDKWLAIAEKFKEAN